MKKNGSIKSDERALTITIELLLTFSISAILLSIVAVSFQGILNSATDVAMYQELGSIGNDVASKIEDLNTMIDIASRSGDINDLSSKILIPEDVGGSPYTLKLESGLIRLMPEVNRNIEIKVPFSPKIPVTNCNISSMDKSIVLEFNRTSGTILFENAASPVPDTTPPTVKFISPSPANGSTINQTVTLKVNASDNVKVSKVEYYLNNSLVYTAEYPFDWEWNTERYPSGLIRVKAIAYDRSGNTAINDSMIYNVTGLAPGVVSDLSATAQTYPNVRLNWTRPASGSVASYRIYRSTSEINDSNKYFATVLADQWFDSPASYVDSSTNKTPGTKYYYAVTVKDINSTEGPVSNPANATLPNIDTWRSYDLETGVFAPSGSPFSRTYPFTVIFPVAGADAFEVDIKISGSHTPKPSGQPDELSTDIFGLCESKKYDMSATLWFNYTDTKPSNNTAYNLTVSGKKVGSLDNIAIDYVEVFVKYTY